MTPPLPALPEHGPTPSEPRDHLATAAHALVPHLAAGRILDAKVLREAMENAFGASDANGAWAWKHAYDASEAAAVLFLRAHGKAIAAAARDADHHLAMIAKLAALLPSHTRRTEDGTALQQFSTPLELAFVVAQAAGLTSTDRVLEPSAGTGHLAIWADIAGAELMLNEYADGRAALLRAAFTQSVTQHDAAGIDDRLDRTAQPTVVLMNPPFSASVRSEGRLKSATFRHIRAALSRLEPGGRLVAITLDTFVPGNPEWTVAFASLRKDAVLRFSAAVSGTVYRRYGTSMSTRLTVFDKQPATPLPEVTMLPEMASVSDLLAAVRSMVPPRETTEAAASPTPVRPVAVAVAPKRKAIDPRDFAIGKANVAQRLAGAPVIYQPRTSPIALSTSSTALYEPSSVQAIIIADAQPPATPLVQSAAMASVSPPVPTYQPTLPSDLVTSGTLSEAQIESIIYAGHAHQGHLSGRYRVDETGTIFVRVPDDHEGSVRFRRGWFLGDGTGAGKGRQVSGIILDNWLKGRRRAVWISKSDKLVEDAIRDWSALGGAKSDVIALSGYKQGATISIAEGILFTTYATLRSEARRGKASRIDQIALWLGAEFDGVIAFDEAHAMGNAAASRGERGDQKASQQGLAGLRIQNVLPDARVVYVSATGATQVSNLAYASRLGLWSTDDFPFQHREDFIAKMEAGGVAAMEVLSRDLKALGLYTARALSYDGIEYETLVHELTPEQIAIYDSYADAFQIIHQNLTAALEASGITSDKGTLNVQAKSAARSAFESSKQRFFNHLLTSMKTPALIKAIEADLAAGHASVSQIVSTGEALMERRLAEIPVDTWNDLEVDITPREYVLDYLTHSFPTALFEEYTDEDGNLRSRPALDADGNPIICREAERRRDALIEHLGALAAVNTALDQLVWHFGVANVAELTGRSRRIVRHDNGRHSVESRPASVNFAETDAFQGDKKQVLVFSDAGGTGRSYHADKGAPNQRLRVHNLLEPGWRADAAIQGLGRTHRTNQAQPPRFRLVTTNVKGEKRFVSTIARRLDALGAITKGQRQTGGQGMFSSNDNLESDYARLALHHLIRAIVRGKIEGCSLRTFEEQTGLALLDEDGSVKEKDVAITTFLNRLLALKVDMQNLLFDAFQDFLTGIIDRAQASGALDLGVETLVAARFTIRKRRTVYTHETGAQTILLTVDKVERNNVLDLQDALSFQADRAAAAYRHEETGDVVIVSKAPTWTDEEGNSIARVRLVRPDRTETLTRAEFRTQPWSDVCQSAFEAKWAEQVTAVPEFAYGELYLMTGLLLPVWDKLPTNETRVFRLEADNGERVIGRLVDPMEVGGVLRRLGHDVAIELDGEQIVGSVLEHGTVVTLTDNLKIRRARQMGEVRIELVDATTNQREDAKRLGAFTEVVQWKTRLFVPLTAAGAILDALIKRYPVTDVRKAQ